MKDKILSLIDSKDVRDCVSENFDKLSKKQIIDIIYGSPYSLQEKYDIMNQLAEAEKDCGEISYTEYAKRLSEELSHLELKENEVFVLELKRIPKHSRYFSATYQLGVFSNIREAMKIIQSKFIIDKKNCWYELTKFELNNSNHIIKYFISTDGIILASDYYIRFNYDYGVNSIKVAIPLPFKVGDIIFIDSSPFTYPMYGVIIDFVNNIKGANVKCLYFDIEGNINVDSLEDFSVFKNKTEIPLPSPLYRAKNVNEELTGNDENLLTIKEVLTKNKNAAQKICDFVSEYNRDKNFSGLRWKALYSGVIKEYIQA